MISYGIRPPRIYGRSREAFDLSVSLSAIDRQVTRFYHCVALFDWASTQSRYYHDHKELGVSERFGEWQFIAARDGALCIKDFEDALLAANGYLAKATKERRPGAPSAFVLLNTHFPDRAKVRHGAAHTQLTTKNEKQRKGHAHDGAYQGAGIQLSEGCVGTIVNDSLQGAHYTTTWDGKIVSYSLDLESLNKLEEIKVAFFRQIPDDLLRSGA